MIFKNERVSVYRVSWFVRETDVCFVFCEI